MSDVSLVDDYSDLYMHGREFGISKRKNGMSSAGGYSECSFESKWAMNMARQPDRRRQKEFRLEGARLNRQSNGDVETISDWTRRRGRKFECD